MQVELKVNSMGDCWFEFNELFQFCAGNIYQRKDTCNVFVIYYLQIQNLKVRINQKKYIIQRETRVGLY